MSSRYDIDRGTPLYRKTPTVDLNGFKALLGSIDKWEGIRKGTIQDHGADNCPLCNRYDDVTGPDEGEKYYCYGCPISQTTGMEFCRGTPYYEKYKTDKLKARYFKAWLVALAKRVKAVKGFKFGEDE